MSDTLEQELQAAFAGKLAGISPEIVERVWEIDYAPKGRQRSRVPFASAAVSLVAACAAAAVLLLSSGIPDAFAGWTAVPSAVSSAALIEARDVCGSVPANHVLASEARGPYVAVVYDDDSSPWECVSHGKIVFLNRSTPDPPSAFENPGEGKVTLPVITARKATGAVQKISAIQKRLVKMAQLTEHNPAERRHAIRAEQSLEHQIYAAMAGPNSLTAVSGAVGPGVTGVTLILADGKHVAATVRNNWYLAWWPGVTTHNAYPVSILVTTAAGTAAADYSRARLTGLFAPCLGTKRCTYVPARIKLVPGIASQFKQRFGLFRTVPPASSEATRALRPGIWTMGAGADLKQLRAISFGPLGTAVVIPGSGGMCLEIASSGGGTCDPSIHTAAQGLVLSEYSRQENGTGAYTIVGLVPDDNEVVTVHLTSGKTVRLHVKHNVVFGKFTTAPTSVEYRHPRRTIRTDFPAVTQHP